MDQNALSIEKEYARCVAALELSGLLTALPKSRNPGVEGIDGKEYPLPTLERVKELFAHNEDLISKKIPQGFDQLELTPLAMPTPRLIGLLEAAIQRHGAEGNIYQTRRSSNDPPVPVRVNSEKHVWIWEVLRQKLDTDELVYFPQEYGSDHGGQNKSEAINNGAICGAPGWSIGLVESSQSCLGQDGGRHWAAGSNWR